MFMGNPRGRAPLSREDFGARVVAPLNAKLGWCFPMRSSPCLLSGKNSEVATDLSPDRLCWHKLKAAPNSPDEPAGSFTKLLRGH